MHLFKVNFKCFFRVLNWPCGIPEGLSRNIMAQIFLYVKLLLVKGILKAVRRLLNLLQRLCVKPFEGL